MSTTPEQARITELEAEVKRLQDLLQGETKLQEVDNLKHIFVATASHQLRTPLSVMKWIFSVLQTDPELMKMESKMQLINQAYQGLERAIDTVNDLINFTRIEDGKLPVTYSQSDLGQVITKASNWVPTVAESRQVTFETSVSPEIPPFFFDPMLITEVMENLINNALDYSSTPGKVSITATLTEDKQSARIEVRNTGIGILEEDKKNIFFPFFRAANASAAHPDGSGLGLYLSRYILTEHGGTITFESEADKETVFTVILPLRSTDPTVQA